MLNDPKISDLCDHRFFLELDYDTCWSRRQLRTYDPEDQVGFTKIVLVLYYLGTLRLLKQQSDSFKDTFSFCNWRLEMDEWALCVMILRHSSYKKNHTKINQSDYYYTRGCSPRVSVF